MSRRTAALALALLLLALLALSHPGRVAARSLALLPNLFPGASVRPLDWLTAPPRRETFSFESAAGHVEVDVYHPAAAGRYGAVVITLGAGSRPKRDPSLVQFADGLARAGAVVMIPESSTLVAGQVEPAHADMLVQAFQRLRAREDVDPARIGIIGFSVGGGLALLAAEDPRVRDQIAFVNTIGTYYDGPRLLEEIATRSVVVDGRRVPWQPSEHTLRIFKLVLVEALENPADRELLAAPLPGGHGASDLTRRLTPQGQAVLRLLQGVEPAEYAALFERLPRQAIQELEALSPDQQIHLVRARLYVMHDVADSYIPVAHSRALVASGRAATLQKYTEFDIFQHATPDKPVDALTFAANLAKLYWHVYLVCLEFL